MEAWARGMDVARRLRARRNHRPLPKNLDSTPSNDFNTANDPSPTPDYDTTWFPFLG